MTKYKTATAPAENRIWAVAIIVGDNDYGNTFTQLLISLRRVIERINESIITQGAISILPARYQIIEVMRSGILFHYRAFQCAHNDSPENIEATISYLQGKFRVLFNEEAFSAYENSDYDSGAWILDVRDGTITSF